jgi:hypothetical protein
MLYIIGIKCQHPMVRREVLSILRRQPVREGVCNSISTAKVVGRVIEIKEGRSREGQMTQSIEQITV